MGKNDDVITFISKYFSRVAIFDDIIKIVTIIIKKIFEDSKNVKRIRNYVSKCNLYPFFDGAKFADCW